MKKNQKIAGRFREVVLDGKWVVQTNYKAQLSGLSWEQATKKIGSLNTIADLTFHIHYYISGILNVLEGGKLEIKDQFSFNYIPIQSQQVWEALLAKLWYDTEKFASIVEQMNEAQLDEDFSNEQYGDYAKNINALIEHCYYHLGQIVLIKKLQFDTSKLP